MISADEAFVQAQSAEEASDLGSARRLPGRSYRVRRNATKGEKGDPESFCILPREDV